MTNASQIEGRIEQLRFRDFYPWRMQHLQELADACSPNDETRKSAYETLADVYAQTGREKIQQSFSDMVALRSALANNQGTSVTQQFFHQNDAVARGIDIVASKAKEVIASYFNFKANLLHKHSIAPPDMLMPAGDWGQEKLSWEETKEIAVRAFEPLGLSDTATAIANHNGGAGQPFWNSFQKRLEAYNGLMGPRVATHEMGHAIHYDMANENFSDNPELAEIFSLFSETLFMEEMQKRSVSKQQQMALLSNQLDVDVEMVAQVEKLIFEHSAYEFAEKHPGQTVPVEQLWREASNSIFGDSVDHSHNNQTMMDARLMMWDQYIHGPPGYGASYMIGWAAAPKLLEKLKADPDGFRITLSDMLKKGKTVTAQEFLEAFNIDMGQPEFWRGRLQVMRDDIAQLEAIHKEHALAKHTNLNRDSTIAIGGRPNKPKPDSSSQ